MRYWGIFITAFLILHVLCVLTAAQKAAPRLLERTIEVESNVTLSVCVGSGSITVRGWDRDEIRILANQPNQIDIRPIGTKKIGVASKVALENPITESKCIEFGDIELDVPHKATIDLRAYNARVQVVGIGSLNIVNHDGPIDIEQVSQRINVDTIAGQVSIRRSRGTIAVRSGSGSVEITDVKPNEAGEVCQASAVGGDITLDRIGHSLVKASSVNGSLNFGGPLVWAGRYNFQTILGNIRISLPSDSSFRVSATLPKDIKISSDFALESLSVPLASARILEKSASNMLHLDAAHGTADVMLTLASFSGRVYLLKN